MKNETHPLQIIGSLLIDYFRWSQLVPMITVWFFALFMVFMLFFVNHQDESLDGLGAVAGWVAELPVVGPTFVKWAEEKAADDGALHFGGDDFKVGAMKVWAILSLVLMGVGWLVSMLFGPFQPWSLKRKLAAASAASALLMVALSGVYFLSPEMFNGSLSAWLLNFAGISVFVFLVSAWCLTIAHMLGLFSHLLSGAQVSDGVT